MAREGVALDYLASQLLEAAKVPPVLEAPPPRSDMRAASSDPLVFFSAYVGAVRTALAVLRSGGVTEWGGEYDPGFYGSRNEGDGGGDDGGSTESGYFARRLQKKQEKEAGKAKQSKEKIEAEIDRILIKVKAQGMQGLTNKEKKTLQQATDRNQ